MDEKFIFCLKGVLLTEALTHAVRSWGIFNNLRSRITVRSEFVNRLLSCFECTSVWIAALVFIYLYFLDFRFFTFIIVFQRLAVIFNIGINLVDALRAEASNRV